MAIESVWGRRGRQAAALWLASIICAQSVRAAEVVWESRFDPVLAPAFENPMPWGDDSQAFATRSSQLAPAPDGDLYYFAHDALGLPAISRLRGLDLAPLWQRSIRSNWAGGAPLDGRAAAGGALAVMRGMARYTPDGEPSWTRGSAVADFDRPADVGQLDDGTVLAVVPADASAEAALVRIDPNSGMLRDRLPLPASLASCRVDLLAVGPADAIYVAAGCGEEAVERRHVLRLSAAGGVVWTTVWPEGFSLDRSVYGSEAADASGLYLVRARPDATHERVKLSAADGTVAWTRTGNAGVAALDAAGRLLTLQVSDDRHRIEALDVATGMVLWSQSRAWQETTMDLDGAAVYLAGTELASSSGIAERLDVATGATAWQTPLAATTTGRRFRPRDVLAVQSRLFVTGSDCLPWIDCRGRLVGLDAGSGLPVAAVQPAIPHTATVDAVADGPDHQLVSSLEQHAEGPSVRVQRIDATGQIAWEHLWPIPVPAGQVEVRRAGDDVLVSINPAFSNSPGQAGYAYLAKYGEDGILRWGRELRLSPDQLTAWFQAKSDADGNVFVGICTGINDSQVRQILRLGGATGQIDWSLSFPDAASCFLGPAFDVVDGDLLLWETPSTPALGAAPLRISGSDHSLIWSHAGLAASDIRWLARNGDDAYLATGDGRVIAMSLANGQQRWSYQDGDASRRVGFQYGYVADDGDLYLGGWVRWPLAQPQNSRIVVRVDAEHGTPRWVHEGERRAGGTLAAARVIDVAGDRVLFSDTIATTAGYGYVRLSRLDRASGVPVDASVNAQVTVDESLAFDLPTVHAVASDGGLLSAGVSAAPGEPIRPWIAKLVAPALARHGNLTTALTIEPALAGVGDSVQVRVGVAFTGDAPAEGVILSVRSTDSPLAGLFPDALVWSDPVCTATGGTCSAVPTPAGLRARLDLAPGDEAQIVATARVVAAMPGLRAEAYAPYGLFEPDLADNHDAAWIRSDALFADGFD